MSEKSMMSSSCASAMPTLPVLAIASSRACMQHNMRTMHC